MSIAQTNGGKAATNEQESAGLVVESRGMTWRQVGACKPAYEYVNGKRTENQAKEGGKLIYRVHACVFRTDDPGDSGIEVPVTIASDDGSNPLPGKPLRDQALAFDGALRLRISTTYANGQAIPRASFFVASGSDVHVATDDR